MPGSFLPRERVRQETWPPPLLASFARRHAMQDDQAPCERKSGLEELLQGESAGWSWPLPEALAAPPAFRGAWAHSWAVPDTQVAAGRRQRRRQRRRRRRQGFAACLIRLSPSTQAWRTRAPGPKQKWQRRMARQPTGRRSESVPPLNEQRCLRLVQKRGSQAPTCRLLPPACLPAAPINPAGMSRSGSCGSAWSARRSSRQQQTAPQQSQQRQQTPTGTRQRSSGGGIKTCLTTA